MNGWQSIDSAPKDGTRVLGRLSYAERYTGRLRYLKRITWWGKTSHVPLYGWNYGRDVEDQNLWKPTHWMPLPEPPKGKITMYLDTGGCSQTMHVLKRIDGHLAPFHDDDTLCELSEYDLNAEDAEYAPDTERKEASK